MDDRPIECLLHFPERPGLLAAARVDERVFFWLEDSLLGWFDSAHDGICAMATNNDNSILYTADVKGHIKVWDLLFEAEKPSHKAAAAGAGADHQRLKPQPRALNVALRHHWKAHDQAVVSLRYMHDDKLGEFLLSASPDTNLKLWTAKGRLIGVFGQGNLWKLNNPYTFVARAPDYVLDADVPGLGAVLEDVGEEDEEVEEEEEEQAG
eukprot:CAMPEP_0170155744 /NCGR_PEP_ID=MMETSP0033_2-20121228/61417_1 /TAXON_ID=195969 /ORGANISM="Dolichomastix tenuilepis, Strain CCMP3274" /LENGTH=208 /DNA_ID=CAMNT_0010393075 /DNA_START=38 /DNA_END=661 /DNA_ORIENTATION=-